MEKERWIYSRDKELYWEYSEEYDTKEEAIKAANEDNEIEKNYVFVGIKAEPYVHGIDLYDILDNVSERSTLDLRNGVGDDFLMNVKKEHYNELEKAINKMFFDWIEKYDYQPDWFLVEDIEKIDLSQK